MTRQRLFLSLLLPAFALVATAFLVTGCQPSEKEGGYGESTSPEPATTVYVRKDINSYAPDSEFIKHLRTGVAAMQSRPVTDPTSWGYQANIHGVAAATGNNCQPNSSGQPLTSWATCQHGSWFFLAWHRMYLYYFERILRDASGDPDFALPFWDYENQAQWPLPVVFREPADASNPLYVAERNTTPGENMNAGDPLPGSDTSATLALSRIPFSTPTQSLASTTFGGWAVPAPIHFAGGYGQLERLPHNAIHNDVGGPDGWMSDPDCAARDAIFWLHHANIDRLWQVWLNQDAGRHNPTPPAEFLSQPFTFFDVGGSEVTLTGADILNTVTQLDYRYEGVPAEAPAAAAAAPAAGETPAGALTMLATGAEEGIELGSGRTDVSLAIKGEAKTTLTQSLAAEGAEQRPVILTLEGLTQLRRGVNYEVYVNLPAGTEPDPKGPHYAGTVAVFLHDPEHAIDYSLDIGATLRALAAEGESTDEIKVSFVPSGPRGAVAEKLGEAQPSLRFKRLKIEG